MDRKRYFSFILSAIILSLLAFASRSARAGATYDFSGVGIGASATDVMSLLVADLDMDGYQDVITGNSGGELKIWDNDHSPFDNA
jgi:FG-GAP repeat